jgi:hypothetical protein
VFSIELTYDLWLCPAKLSYCQIGILMYRLLRKSSFTTRLPCSLRYLTKAILLKLQIQLMNQRSWIQRCQ